MTQWTPEQTFLMTYIAAASSGIAVLLRSHEPLTPRSILSAILYYGAAGTGLGMVSWQWLGGKQEPWKVVGCGFLVGIRIIKLNDIMKVCRRVIGTNATTNGTKSDE